MVSGVSRLRNLPDTRHIAGTRNKAKVTKMAADQASKSPGPTRQEKKEFNARLKSQKEAFKEQQRKDKELFKNQRNPKTNDSQATENHAREKTGDTLADKPSIFNNNRPSDSNHSDGHNNNSGGNNNNNNSSARNNNNNNNYTAELFNTGGGILSTAGAGAAAAVNSGMSLAGTAASVSMNAVAETSKLASNLSVNSAMMASNEQIAQSTITQIRSNTSQQDFAVGMNMFSSLNDKLIEISKKSN